MTHATYLVRFDDICPTMNWEAWEQVENVLVSEGIRPILAVVPDNRDENLEWFNALQNYECMNFCNY